MSELLPPRSCKTLLLKGVSKCHPVSCDDCANFEPVNKKDKAVKIVESLDKN